TIGVISAQVFYDISKSNILTSSRDLCIEQVGRSTDLLKRVSTSFLEEKSTNGQLTTLSELQDNFIREMILCEESLPSYSEQAGEYITNLPLYLLKNPVFVGGAIISVIYLKAKFDQNMLAHLVKPKNIEKPPIPVLSKGPGACCI
ncbi:hypothetical protein N9Y92_04345, partial [Chlamydiales bacterium]|nr:hypothetical protein [Chlamydiales bacterium]